MRMYAYYRKKSAFFLFLGGDLYIISTIHMPFDTARQDMMANQSIY